MKQLSIYILALLLAASCSTEILSELAPAGAETAQTQGADGEMTFIASAAALSRVSSNGVYGGDTTVYMPYPVEELFLTTYHHDRLEISQWYFQDIKLTPVQQGSDLIWKAHEWYWPIQGDMEFLSYWSPKVYGNPEFYEYINPVTGRKSAEMVVKATGAIGPDGERAEGLDGKTDFLYIARAGVMCPQSGPLKLTYRHGLSWLTLSLQGLVPGEGPNGCDEAATAELIDMIKVQKIVIEDVARKGTAYLVPGLEVAWIIDPADVKDQLYTRPVSTTYPRGTYAYFTWEEVDNGATETVPDYVTLSATEQFLGLYTPQHPGEYTGNGLLLVPQHKTAITVYYKIKNGRKDYDDMGNVVYHDLEVAERYELRDNEDEWEPGKHYHYNIRFKSTVEQLQDHIGVEVLETVYEILRTPENPCFDTEAFGQITVGDSNGNTYRYTEPVFILDPLHNSGSPFQDEMDYRDGGQIF